MANPDRQARPDIARTEQSTLNNSFDEVYKVLAVALLGEYNSGLYRLQVDSSGNLKVNVASGGTSSPTTIYNGKKTVTTAGTRVTLASSQAVQSVTIKALSTNTGTIYVGDTSVASTNGFQLSAGETVSMDISNLNTVNLDASVSGEGVTYVGVS